MPLTMQEKDTQTGTNSKIGYRGKVNNRVIEVVGE